MENKIKSNRWGFNKKKKEIERLDDELTQERKKATDLEQRVSELERMLADKDKVIRDLAKSFGRQDLKGIIDSVQGTLADQMNRNRDEDVDKYHDLSDKLEQGREKVDKLYAFITATMRHVGRLEGQMKHTGNLKLAKEDCDEIVSTANSYMPVLMSR